MVLTAHFLLKRGYCCNSGCRHCPYKEGGSMPNGAVTIIGVQGPTPGEETPGEETPGEETSGESSET